MAAILFGVVVVVVEIPAPQEMAGILYLVVRVAQKV
jgi:hypothetical protein